MSTATIAEQVQVIDVDTHVIEPPDLWTARVPGRLRDLVPSVGVKPGSSGRRRWHLGDKWLYPEGAHNFAGWPHYPPSVPERIEDGDPGGWDPVARLKRMDEYGLYAQVLYPNLLGMHAETVMAAGNEVANACVRAYNDFVTGFAATDPKRLLAIAAIPFWDIDAAVAEIGRVAAMGHKGILFANQFERIGLPHFCNPYWDRIYDAAQSCGLPVNFHAGFSLEEVEHDASERAETFDARWTARRNAIAMMASNSQAISSLVSTGLCERFPRLDFVSVESGMGYLPYLLDSLDWHWKGHGAFLKHPTLPSEYFRRQCYGTFWFETSTLDLLELYPDNFMFETDFPHPTSMSPGLASPADVPSDHIQKHFARRDPELTRKVLHDNAARVYGL